MSNLYQEYSKFDKWIDKASIDELYNRMQSIMNKDVTTFMDGILARRIQRQINKRMKNKLYVKRHQKEVSNYCVICGSNLVHKPAIDIKKRFFAEKVECSNCNYVQVIGY